MGQAKDLTGQRFGRLTAISAEKDKEGRRYIWTCLCDCGNYTKATTVSLTHGLKKSCGCIQRDILYERNEKHGHSRERLYNVWKGMRSRCRNPHHKSYFKYGGRGIDVCHEWDDYEAFRQWALSNGYQEDAKYGICTLDRVDVNKGYAPDNCRWVDELTQANNTRVNRLLTYNGKTQTVAEWSRELEISLHILYARLNALGWSVEKTLSTPVRKCEKRNK